MTDTLHLPATPDAPIACDMSTASDTPEERIVEYVRLFDGALLRRKRHPDSVVFHLSARNGTRAAVDSLARREAACCPFADYRVETAGDEVVYTITNPITDERKADVDAMLDEFHALPERAVNGVAQGRC
jgi:hypothetical protein